MVRLSIEDKVRFNIRDNLRSNYALLKNNKGHRLAHSVNSSIDCYLENLILVENSYLGCNVLPV